MDDDSQLLDELRHADAHTMPVDDNDLHQYIKSYLGYAVPRVAVCKHHVAPFQFIADVFFERETNIVVLANRTGGKTRNLSILNHLNAVHKPLFEIANIGAIKEQALKGFSYLKEYADIEWFKQDVVFSIMRETRYRNGSIVQVLAGTTSGVNSPHPLMLVVDETELISWTDVLQEAFSCAQSRHGFAAVQILASTRKYASGNMHRLLVEKPKEPSWPYKVYAWCVAAGEPVLTENGWVPIEGVNVGERIISFDGKQFVWDRITNSCLTREKAPVIQIVLEDGRTLRVTKDHLVLTTYGWVQAGQLDRGDLLCYTYGGGINYHDKTQTAQEKPYRSTLFPMWRTNARQNLPPLSGMEPANEWSKLDTSLSQLWGMDTRQVLQKMQGYRKRKTAGAPSRMPDLWWSQIIFGQEMQRLPYEKAGRMASLPRGLRGNAGAQGNARSQDEGAQIFNRIPTENVRNKEGSRPLEQGKALVRRSKGQNKGGANQGICRREIPQESNKHRTDCQGVVRRQKGYMGKRMGNPRFSFPPGSLPSRIKGWNRMQWGLLALAKRFQKARFAETEAVQRSQYPTLGSMGTHNQKRICPENALRLVRITSIKSAGNADVYDLSVEKHHNFIANGLIVHNCLWESLKRCELPDCGQCKEIIRIKDDGTQESWYDLCHDDSERYPEGKARFSDGFFELSDAHIKYSQMDEGVFNAQWLCLRPGRKGLVFGSFDEEIHCKSQLVAEWKARLHKDRFERPVMGRNEQGSFVELVPRELEIAIIIDIGWTDPLAILFVAKDRRDNLFCFDSIYQRELDLRDLKPVLLEKLGKYNIPLDFEMRCDQRAPREINDLNEMGFKVNAVWLEPDERMRLIRKWLSGGYREGYPTICVDPETCPDLCDEFNLFKFPMGRDGNPKSESYPDKGPNHLLDTLGYGMNVFGLATGGTIIAVHRSKEPPRPAPIVPTRSDWMRWKT
jgi:hypothetical protein